MIIPQGIAITLIIGNSEYSIGYGTNTDCFYLRTQKLSGQAKYVMIDKESFIDDIDRIIKSLPITDKYRRKLCGNANAAWNDYVCQRIQNIPLMDKNGVWHVDINKEGLL